MTSRAWQENAASADVTAAEHRLSRHGDVTKSKDRRRGSQQQTDTGSENNWTSSGETTKRGSVELAPDFELTHIRAKVLEKYGDRTASMARTETKMSFYCSIHLALLQSQSSQLQCQARRPNR